MEGNLARWWSTVERQARVEADPVNPMLLFWELNSRLPQNAIVTADSGSAANRYARDLKIRAPDRGGPAQQRPEPGHLGTAGHGRRAQVRGVPDPAGCVLCRLRPLADLEGIEVEKPEAIGPAWDRALAADRPVVLDVHCDPDIPPHTDFEQLKDVAEAIIKGDPDAIGVVKKGLRTKAQELFIPRQEVSTA
ncbi:hypothetical protein ABT120_48695 [Nonomuraea angiospora]|uniref:hypothetical protein n=1 Tax=Nonomuraea angiospora TaxID=46172 RepID=UPI00332FE123